MKELEFTIIKQPNTSEFLKVIRQFSKENRIEEIQYSAYLDTDRAYPCTMYTALITYFKK